MTESIALHRRNLPDPRSPLMALWLVLLLTTSAAAAPRNVLLICIDDLRPELRCFGVDYIHSPNIDALAARGRAFTRHFVQAPTCGASRYTLLTGRYGSGGNGALFARAAQLRRQPDAVPPSMPAWFRKHGYTTVSVGKVSHHPGGRGGKDWNLDAQPEMPNSWDRHLLPAGPWQHPRGWMHGLANGEIRKNAKDMDVFQSVAGPDSIYPDGISIQEALKQMDQLATAVQEDAKPFFLAVGILRPHLPFGAPAKYMAPYKDASLPPIPHPQRPAGKTTWHGSGEFMKYNRWKRNPNDDPSFATAVRKHYAACVSYADAQVGKLMGKLADRGLGKDTVVVVWGDHGWHLGEHAVWGKHTLFEESLRSPLIVVAPELKAAGEPTAAMVETLDIFPTLCELTDIPIPDFADGTSLAPQLRDPAASGHPALAYHRRARTVRTDEFRLVVHQDGTLELYDHQQDPGETENVAANHPKVVSKLREQLESRLRR